MRYISASIVTACALACSTPAAAQTTLTATFSRGAVAEYSNGPNGTDNGALFSSLNISSMTISQLSANGTWGGTQGNDTSVTAKITFTNGNTVSFPAAINWVKNAGGGQFDWVGLTIGAGTTVSDGYNLTPGKRKTYVLQFAQSSLNLSTLLPNDLDGSANAGAALDALNLYFPASVAAAPVITGATAVSVNENQQAVTTLGANKAVTWAITGGADGAKFAISAAGVITFVTAPDFETPTDSDHNNSYVLVAEATDSNGGKSTHTVTVTVLNLDEVAPVVTAGQVLAYPENRAANAIVGTVAATDSVGVTGFQFTASGTQTSADGFYLIDNGGVIRITAAGVAAGIANNDFEIGPNSFIQGVQAQDAAGNWSASADVTLSVTDEDDAAPTVVAGQGFNYAENRSANDPIGTVAASDNVAVTTFRFSAGGTQTSADGYYTIDNRGLIRITAAGAAAGRANNDFEVTPNNFNYGVQAGDAAGNWSATEDVTLNVTDVNEATANSAPTVGAGQSFTYAENRNANAQVGVVAASDDVAVTSFRFSATGTQTSGDGYFSIDDAGVVRLTAAGAAAGVASNDYEVVPNSFTHAVEASDSAGLWSAPADVVLNVTDQSDTPPVITGPNGSTGPTASISVPEGTTAVTQMTANVPISSWQIIGGNDQGRFAIDPQGSISFVASPDYEAPADSDTDNSYVLVIEGTDANGNRGLQTITVNVTDRPDTPPVLTGPGGSTGPAARINVPEGTTTVTQVTANVPISSWSIVGGNDGGRFVIDAQGNISFVASPDYEAPADSNADNSYVLVIEGTDTDGNTTKQIVTVDVTDRPDTPPVLSGPGGATGASSAVSVPEGTTTVATVTANVPISSWTITGGNDQGRFTIDPQGNLRFVAAPDHERPTDSDANNSYVLVIEGTDADGNRSAQTITVSVTDLADTPPAISGPSGGAGALASAIAVEEGTTAVTTLTADVPVSWSIVAGNDRGQFAVSPAGVLTFVAAPNFESPADSDRNNSYVLTVEARDASGNVSIQTITVTVANVDELQQRLDEIGGNLRGDLRNRAFSSLSTTLSFNEGLLGLDSGCAGAGAKPLRGGVNANEQRQDASVRYARDLSSCEARTRVMVDGGVGFSRVAGEWSTRGLASLRAEQKVGSRTVLGAALIGTAATDELASFGGSDVSDRSLQLNLYGRTYLTQRLRFAAFAGLGRSWYDFKLSDGGLVLDGDMTGKRHLYGAALSGDIDFAGLTMTTDAILSRAVEKLGSAGLDGSFAGESRSDMLFRLGKVDVTRLSVPVHVPIVFNRPADGREATRLDISPGLLCQDTAQDSSSLECGYQLGFKFRLAPSVRSLLRAEARTEAVDGYLLSSLIVGFQRSFGPNERLAWGMDVSRQARVERADNRLMVRVGLGR